MKPALEEVRKVFAGKYGFDPDDERAVRSWDTVAGQKVMRNILLGIQIFLGIIGGLTLMIGGVGVANIMYATVKERTREIGVKMALGARPGVDHRARCCSKGSPTRCSADCWASCSPW